MKAFGLTLLSFFIISIFSSLNNPPGIPLTEHKENELNYFYNSHYNDNNMTPAQRDINEELKSLRKDYGKISNFRAHYANTILTWFGKPRYLYDHYPKFWIDNPEKISHYLIKSGSIMPYIIVFSLIFAFIFYLFRLDK